MRFWKNIRNVDEYGHVRASLPSPQENVAKSNAYTAVSTLTEKRPTFSNRGYANRTSRMQRQSLVVKDSNDSRGCIKATTIKKGGSGSEETSRSRWDDTYATAF
ncbi:hypothetical protein J1614_004860 [Plenodomus biglobosus]|nr:hypothetical protein J1614_004860 [Plenodomus biglobosus]